ncbi:hypothetical protein RIR_jg24353.t1 [Rhizophagus irregularis DAOM 181602=DAOM 197198]|nr:hypothetical protein RIR_jg24353.t1 [Rhizophagus irregularis DAOM 181602=DAOM 197198]
MKSKCYDTEKLAELRELRIELGFHMYIFILNRANKHLKGGNKWGGVNVRSKVCIQRQRLNERNKWTKI